MGSQIGDDVEVEMRELCSISPTCTLALSKYVLNISRVKAVAKRCSRFKVPYSHNAKPYEAAVQKGTRTSTCIQYC